MENKGVYIMKEYIYVSFLILLIWIRGHYWNSKSFTKVGFISIGFLSILEENDGGVGGGGVFFLFNLSIQTRDN